MFKKILDFLEKNGDLENTLIIVTADNGMPFPRAKANVYEYGSHIQKSTGKYLKFDSYITHEEDLTFGSLRLLEVDYRIKLPVNKKILLLITSGDVLHSWSVPSLGVKVDACPGRLNQVSVHLLRTGVFYGQCSEICGINHGFIPIVVEGIDEVEYRNWVYKGILKQ